MAKLIYRYKVESMALAPSGFQIQIIMLSSRSFKFSQ